MLERSCSELSYYALSSGIAFTHDQSTHLIPAQSVCYGLRNLQAGSAVRQTGQTAMNDQSSRSHAIFSLTLTQQKHIGQGQLPTSARDKPPSSTPSRIAQRQSGGLPHPSALARIGSPTPGSRPGTPGERRLLPRPSSSFRETRAASPAPGKDDSIEKIAGGDSGEWVTITSKFHWVDLAGSERVRVISYRSKARSHRSKCKC